MLHGFAGYFEAVLYENVGLSIHPERKDVVSKDMLSWFPLFFPFKVSLLQYVAGTPNLFIGTSLLAKRLRAPSFYLATHKRKTSVVRMARRVILIRSK